MFTKKLVHIYAPDTEIKDCRRNWIEIIVDNQRINIRALDRIGSFDLDNICQYEICSIVALHPSGKSEESDENCNKWIQWISGSKIQVPIILAYDGKCDMSKELAMKNIISSFDESKNVVKVMEEAKDAAMYPRSNLVDLDKEGGYLRPSVIRALRRIFNVMDVDGDGYIHEDDIRSLGTAYEGMAPNVIKIGNLLYTLNRGEFDPYKGFTFRGFLILFHLLLNSGNEKILWNILHHFGYDNHVRLKVPTISGFNSSGGLHVHFSKNGKKFLTKIFNRKASIYDSLTLSVDDLEDILFVCSDLIDLVEKFEVLSKYKDGESNVAGRLSLASWLCFWDIVLKTESTNVPKYLKFLGYEEYMADELGGAFSFDNRLKVVLVVLLGSSNEMKRKIINFLENSNNCWACNFPFEDGDEMIIFTTDEDYLSRADVLCICYDCQSIESFSVAIQLFNAYSYLELPVVLLGIKAHHQVMLPPVQLKFTNQLSDRPFYQFCVCSMGEDMPNIFKELFKVADRHGLVGDRIPSQIYPRGRRVGMMGISTIAVGLLIVGAFGWLWHVKKRR